MPYRHLTLEERRALFRLLHAKVPITRSPASSAATAPSDPGTSSDST